MVGYSNACLYLAPMNLRKLLEFALKILLGGVFLFGGADFVRDYNLGALQQVGFWLVVVLLFYWLIVRDTSISDSARVESIDAGRVTVEFPLHSGGEFGSADERDRIHAFADKLSSVVEASRGEYDGDEFGANRCKLFFFTSSPDELFTRIEPMLRESDFADGMVATLTRSADDKPYRRIVLTLPNPE